MLYRFDNVLNIVLQLTCLPDDAIQRLKPSLERHRGCDIVDVCPAVGIWSTKIHELLQPRRHLIIEPSYEQGYKQYLQPLLDAPNSKFKLLEWKNEREHRNPTRYLKEGLLPDQKGLNNDSPKTGGCNDSLLFLVNFGGFAVSGRKKTRENSEQWMIDWFKDANAEEGFHRNGFVRLLAWMYNNEKSYYVTRSVTDRVALSWRTDLISHAEEVVGASADEIRHRRSSEIEYLSSAAALDRMEAAGMSMNPERLDHIPKDILRAKQDSANFDIKAIIPALDTERHERREWHAELKKLEADYAKGKFKKPKEGNKDPEGDDAYRRMAQFQSTDRSQRKWEVKISDMVGELQTMDREDAALRADTTLTEDERKQKLAALDEQASAFQEKVDKLPFLRLNFLASQGDNAFAWNASPKLLTWDHRRAEPLICYPTDFHPIRDMALVDFQLHDQPIKLPPRQYRYFEMCTYFGAYMYSGTVAAMLERMHFGAAVALLPKCPSLRDPTKGGRRNPGLVTCRSLSREMLVELAYAWADWVFAPSAQELYAAVIGEIADRKTFKGLKKLLGRKERIRPRGEELKVE